MCILFLLSDSQRAHSLFKRPRLLRSNWDDVTRVYGLDEQHYCAAAETELDINAGATTYSRSNREPISRQTRVYSAPLPKPPVPFATSKSAEERRAQQAFRMREWAKTR